MQVACSRTPVLHIRSATSDARAQGLTVQEVVSVLWEREEHAWVLHLRSGAELEVPLSVGPFHGVVGLSSNGGVSWLRIYDDPDDENPGSGDVDPGWAAEGGVIEFRLRKVTSGERAHATGVPLRAGAVEGLVYVGWEEHPARRLCAVGLGGSLASADLYPERPPGTS